MLRENLLRALRFAMVFPDSCAAIVQNSQLGLLFLVSRTCPCIRIVLRQEAGTDAVLYFDVLHKAHYAELLER